MKRVVAIMILIILLVISVSGCGAKTESGNREYVVCDGITMILVENGDYFNIYVHKETRVMYIGESNTYQGSMSIMLDENGDPLLWDGDL